MLGQLYRMNQARIIEMLADEDTSTVVPACPDWSAADLVRHLTGLAADIVAGEATGYGSDEWTDAQITSRRDQPYADVIAEWSSLAESMGAILDDVEGSSIPEIVLTSTGPQPRKNIPVAILGDLMHHEFDLRNAVGNRDDRDRPDVVASAIGHVKALRPEFGAKGLATVRVMVDGNAIDIGRDAPQATVRMPAFETLRSIGGRRTLDEMRSYEWEGDVDRYLPHMVLPPMRPARASLGEQ